MAQYKTYTSGITKIHIAEQADNERVQLLQVTNSTNEVPLSYLRWGTSIPKAITNCSFFHIGNDGKYVIGRNQGDIRNATTDQSNTAGYSVVLYKDGAYAVGLFNSGDHTEIAKIEAGFTSPLVAIENGIDVNKYSTSIGGAGYIDSKNPLTALLVLNNKKRVLVVSEGRQETSSGVTGLTPRQLRAFLRTKYSNIELMVFCDGGGSSEMIVDGVIRNRLSDGKERPMFNGLALIEKEVKPEPPGPDPEPPGPEPDPNPPWDPGSENWELKYGQNDFAYTIGRNVLFGDGKRTIEDVVEASELHTMRTRVAPGNPMSNIIKIRNGYYIYTLEKNQQGSVNIDLSYLKKFNDSFLFELLVKNLHGSDFTFLFDNKAKFYKADNASITYNEKKIYHFEFLSFNGSEWFISLKGIYGTTEPEFINHGMVPSEDLYPAETLYPADWLKVK